MPYNNPAPTQSSTLTADERSQEAKRLLELLRQEPAQDLERKLTASALRFVQAKRLELDWSGRVNVTLEQLWRLRDSRSQIV